MRSCEKMTPTNTGTKYGEDNCPCNGAAKNLSLRREGPPLSPAASLAPKLWQRQWRPIGGFHAQRRGDGAHKYRRQGQTAELTAQQRGKKQLPEGEGLLLEPCGLIGTKIMAAAMAAARRTPCAAAKRGRP